MNIVESLRQQLTRKDYQVPRIMVVMVMTVVMVMMVVMVILMTHQDAVLIMVIHVTF